jgi:mono/diheme cytochrome c family protein
VKPERKMQRSILNKMALSLAAASALAACTAPGGPDRIKASFGTDLDAGSGGGNDDAFSNMQVQLKCHPANVAASMTYPARSTITMGEAHSSGQPTYFTADLFTLFKASCGGCHVESNSGGFVVGASSFAAKIDQHVLDVIESNDPKTYMPPIGKPFKERADGDPVKLLDTMLHEWMDQGKPADSFALPVTDTSSSDPLTAYLLSPDLGNAMTNIGTCVPDRGMVGTSTKAMDSLDTFFAQATDLPATLDKTDLYTLDSEALAREGVISYQPTYPLWTDNAGKMRYVRVPRGKSIVFDKQTQQFQIPANTRFYKTFLKQVKDVNGNMGWRKIETRVIVSRPDVDMPDGTVKQTAIFGTYVWNQDESQATLLNDPLRDGQPFADRIFTYVTDEQVAQPIIDAAPANLLQALQKAGVTRHYALPGAERCIQCHMGSPNKAFILAFSPLQINRRKTGTGGLYEPGQGETVSDEELSQLQRLIDYGLISGISSPADVLPLEQSQGTRQPRTPEELNAQAYMIGNCSHCHNPRGLPSVREPAVGAVLNFLPGAGQGQGIFQFSLDAVSPVRKRGLYQDTDIPYITPSLYDIPIADSTAKYFCPDEEGGSCVYTIDPGTDPNKPPAPVPRFQWVLAPWRSLIYRNTDTPYDYFDDFALYPHMPLNSPGYDCRAAQKMGDWMVSIPAVLKDPTKIDSARPNLDDLSKWGPSADLDAQPYREVKQGDADYETAKAAAQDRLDKYHKGVRYNWCPDTYTKDIIDPKIQEYIDKNQPVATNVGEFTDKDGHVLMPAITPFSPHFVTMDNTDPAGDWFPRRTDWESAIVNPDIPAFVAKSKVAQTLNDGEAADLQNVLTALTSVKLTEVRSVLTTEVAFGLWDTSKSGCDFTGVPTVASFTGAARPQWMDRVAPPATAPVYVESPGAAVFTSICYNCHGQNADSKGLLAEEISTLTGGDARVANFRDGLFGPATAPGQNRGRVFDPSAGKVGGGVTGDDLAARYLAWMALGGTSKFLPRDVLTQVTQAPVLGVLRQHISPQGTPDMLRLGLQLCSQLAASEEYVQSIHLSDLFAGKPISWSNYTALVDRNYDAEMWLRLCSLGNRPLVRVPFVSDGSWIGNKGIDDVYVSGYNLYWGESEKDASGKVESYYGANPAMDASGNITTGLGDNTFPICIAKPTSAAELDAATQWLGAHKVRGNAIPFCPPGLVTDAHKLQAANNVFPDGRKWAARGAVNAALAVFLYLDDIERHPEKRKPLYNQCSALGKK